MEREVKNINTRELKEIIAMDCSIIGMSIRVEGCDSNHIFWETLLEEDSFMKPMSKERWELLCEGTDKKWGDREEILGMYLENIDSFDSSLFKLSGGVSKFMDPRQRLLLEACWGAVEDAGLKMSNLKGKRVGVFIAHDGFDFAPYYQKVSEEDLSFQDFVIPGNATSFLANKISYLLDFKGPSMTIDSTCSSIYVALHHAKTSLEKGECDYAIVGGVSLFLEPWKNGEVTPTAFEAVDNQINSFSNKAAGYCSSEGCGALLLTRDDIEEEQGYSSYGIIRGTGYNSGGKTNSFAQPSQKQQTLLFREVLDAAQIATSDIEYVEAHGISSLVGDAIEAKAIIDVFKRDTHPCYVSTIKPNIGHAHAASGLYSLMKAILAIKYKYIPAVKGLKGKSLNEDIPEDTQGITFLKEGVSWDTPKQKHVLLTSYGFSNVNAAILLSEPISSEVKISDYQIGDKAVICLSANTKAQVYQQMERLVDFLTEQKILEERGADIQKLDCHQIAHTLLVGREAMTYRWVALVTSIEELITTLGISIAQKDAKEKDVRGKDVTVTFWGDPKENKEALATLKKNPKTLDQKLIEALETLDYKQLVEYWLIGVNIKWENCYKKKELQKIHLPIYPFSKKSYWLSKSSKIEEQLHPLIHRNSSNFKEQRFTSVYTGKEKFLSEHQVRGEQVLPGVAYLEMVRAAAAFSIEEPVIKFENVRWLSPITTKDTAKEIHINLFEEEQGIGYEIYSIKEENEEETIYGQGKLAFDIDKDRPQALDLQELQNKFSQNKNKEECYSVFKEIGIELGSSYQAIESLYHNEKESLSKLSLPKDDRFMLQPGLLDSALQSSIYLSTNGGELGLQLPFRVKEISIYGEPSQIRWSYIKQREDTNRVKSYDAFLLDEKGEVLMTFYEFTLMPLDGFQEIGKIKNNDRSLQQNEVPALENKKLKEQATNYFTSLIASTLQLEKDQIAINEPFENYGFDSVMVIRLWDVLKEIFKNLSSTILFEYQNLADLIDYFLIEYPDHFSEMYSTPKLPSTEFDNTKIASGNVISRRKSYALRSKQLTKPSMTTREDIAIIGLSGRYPGANTINDFWEVLKTGKDCITEIPSDRWDVNEMYDSEKGKTGKSYSKWGGFIEDVDKFDPLFFNISPREAELIDPQERLFLQTAWESIEDGGYTRKTLNEIRSSKSSTIGGHVGVYVGVMYSEYQLLGVEESARGNSLATWSSPSSIANRVSYHLNLHGPSMGIDTMCSSSLTAIHLAVEAIHNGQCSMAIAGGVNISIHSNKYKMLSQSMFVSGKGKCESFGEGGEGYVPSEGVGAVLLKPLHQAKKDGDQIYGVIKGSSLSHGGKTNGYTVPNPNAQAEVITEAIKRAGVQPEDFSYVEAHGTGTSLGDPIEISGLSKAFKNNSKTGQYCAIGSVKSNIGHAESAAGISGLTKVLLQFKHQQLVPSLHSSSLNDKIDFKQTPFIVQQELEEWKAIDNKQRLAGISSFGAGGSNAHLVIEEHISVSSPSDFLGPYVFVLSARNIDRLEVQVANLRSHLEKEKLMISLASVAYTLQIGREAMEERLSFVANSVEEVISCLSAYMSGDTSNVYTGNIKNRNSNFLLEGEAGKSYIDTAIRNNELKSLSRLWVEGIDINWSLLYGATTPSKISLPTYPFSRERYWAYDKPSVLLQGESNLSQLHPLVHRNISDLKTQCFSSVFTGKETFFSDHIVNGNKMLPGVAYLELARAGGEQSIHKPIKQFKNVSWLNAIKVDTTSEEVQIKIYPRDEDFGYEIYTLENDELYLKSQGEMSTKIQSSPPKYNLEEITKQFVKSKRKEECYEFFKTLGLDYGSDFQGIEQLWYDDSNALSKVVLPKDSDYILSPKVLDSALQTCYGLILDQENQHLAIPFSVKEINVYKDLPETLWSYVRKKENKSSYENNLINCDVDLLDEEGEVIVSFRDLIALPIDENQKSKSRKKVATHFYNYNWVVSPEVSVKESNDFQLVLVGGGSVALVDKLKESFEFDIEKITGETEEEYFLHVFNKIKDEIEEKKRIKITLLYDNNDEVNYSFISGLLKSANRENPNISGKILGVDNLSVANIENLISVLGREQNTTDTSVRYVADKREVREFQIQEALPTPSKNVIIKEGGVYLITGGAGGLGFLFAEYISNLYDTIKIVLVGRKKVLSPEKQKKVNEIRGAVYYDCDITDNQEVIGLVQNIKEKYKKLDGIIHSAGVADSNNILKETESNIRKILLPKIKGTKIIDEVTKNENLDFSVYFSSTSALLGDIGLATYASANAFMDSYANYRNSLQKQGKRKGVSISINWPLWEEGGLQVSDAVKVYLEQQLGMVPIPKKEGLKAFDEILKHSLSQGIVFYGYKDKIAENFKTSSKDKTIDQSSIVDQEHYEQIKEASIKYISGLLSEEFKLPKGQLDSRTPFSEYGIDSILTIKLTNRLNTVFDDISNTLFFEYQTVEELVSYFIEEYPSRLVDLIALDTKAYDPKYDFDKTILSNDKNETYRLSSESKLKVSPSNNFVNEDIAIIGLSGRYPGANNISEFWDNLASGKDSVTEVPKDRWDINTMYDSEKGKLGVSYSKWGGFIDDVDKFDPLFFSISPSDAELMDPQERLFLQTVWEAIEDSGYTKTGLSQTNGDNESLRNNIGVYAGLMYQDYSLFGVQSEKGVAIPAGVAANIANRVSYFFNFKGPSITLDTMCSSSLTAIHLACQELITGGIHMAIAGGVNLSVHPNKYVILSQRYFLSTRGKCESFGAEGDGYVPGEGVGAVLLKRLSEAERDGDHIYGIIKGSSINHGGKSNGYTVPDPNAQSNVIREAIQKAGIHAEDLSYIEAHGTGTSLGDPIEIAGLSKAFQSEKKQYCAIGSVKSNIGHAESAAGISGLTKVLLQLKHQQLAPSLHSSSLNDKINFEKTPFKVQQELGAWRTVDNQPRLAGLSGFGAGGSNAHLIIEEYIKVNKSYISDIPAVIVLSAQNAERLKVQVANLKTFIDRESDSNIYDIAYTLQIGRESMQERLAFSASNLEELLIKLNDFEAGVVSDLYKGNSKRDASSFVIKGHAGKAYVKTAIAHKELDSLMQLWTTGVDIDWDLLYVSDYKPSKISLPTYPFAKERYWFSKYESSNTSESKSHLHPLLHVNTSNLKEQRFTTVFTGKESFLTDHKVGKEKVFPGVGYLEMAREAGSISLETPITQIKDITWLKPVSVNGKPKEVHVSLFEKNGLINYDIFSGQGDSEIIHGQGQLFSEALLTSSINLEALRSRLPNKKRGSECYEFFNELGLGYGRSFQGIESLYYSSSESLSKINLVKESGYILQPGLLDSALQTCIALSMEGSINSLNLPFSVKEVNIYGAVSETVWCYARKSIKNKDNKIKSYDIDMLSSSGTVLLSFKEFLILPIGGLQQEGGNESVVQEDVKLYLYENQWKNQSINTSINTGIADHTILLIGGSSDLANKLEESLRQNVISIKETTELSCFIEVLDIVKSHLQSKEKKKITLVYNNNAYQDYGFISGLLKTAEIESTKLVGKTIGVSDVSIAAFDELVNIIKFEQEDRTSEVRYMDGDRSIRQLSRLSASTPKEKLEIKEGGVYLITGGSGGLGKIFARHISQTKGTRVLLAGRSKTSKLSIQELDEFNAVYHSCDMTDKASVDLLIKRIITDYDTIDGIIHSAGVINDGVIVNKTHEESYVSIAPKILGAKNLDLATKDINLDFMVYFSSMAGVLGNIGQCDYASANAWLDNYASYRNQLKEEGERQGRTLSINWPLWQDGGMHIGADSENYMKHKLGLHPLPLTTGILAFEKLLEHQCDQGIVVFGVNSLVEKTFSKILEKTISKNETKIAKPSYAGTGSDNYELLVQLIKETFAGIVKIEPSKLELDREFIDYGADSVVFTKLIQNLNEELGISLSVATLFEYKTIEEFVQHILNDHQPSFVTTEETANENLIDDYVLSETKEEVTKPLYSGSGSNNYELLVQLIKEAFSAIVKMDASKLELDRELIDYGADSVVFTKLVQRLNEELDVSLSIAALFEYKTIEEFVQHILNDHQPNLKNSSVTTGENLVEETIPLPVLERTVRTSSRNRKSDANVQTVSVDDYAIIAGSGKFVGVETDEELWVKAKNGVKLEVPKQDISDGDFSYAKFSSEKMSSERHQVLGMNDADIKELSYQEYLVFDALSEAMEKYNVSRKELSSKPTGVFIAAKQSYIDFSGTGKSNDSFVNLLPNKISFHLDLKGPSEVVNTYCTSVYVAIHRAIQCVTSGECEQAIVGGVNLVAKEEILTTSRTEYGSLFSTDGASNSFSSNAEGFVRSEGVGVIIIKPLAKAKQNSNRILGLIKASSVVHGGKGYSLDAPSASGIKTVIESALTKSKVDVDTIDYIEAHGIANMLADSIELGAIDSVYKKYSKTPNKKWHISSVKPTVGHAELASGMASILKVLKAFEYKTIPGIPGLDSVNTELDPNNSLQLIKESTHWENGTHPRRASLNGYGIGGVNAHLILEEYPNDNKDDEKTEALEIKSEEKDQSEYDNEVNENIGIRDEIFSVAKEVFKLEKQELDLTLSPIEYDFDSISVIQFIRNLNSHFNVELKMGQVLNADTFENIFELCESAVRTKETPVEVVVEEAVYKEQYPLSVGQKGLWFIHVSEPDSTKYNIPVFFNVEGEIEDTIIYEAATQLIYEHPILRVTIDADELTGEPYQEVQETANYLGRDVQEIVNTEVLNQTLDTLLHTRIDIAKEVIRLHVRKDIANNKTYILFVIHHMVFDGVSTIQFITRFKELLNQLISGKKIVNKPLDQAYFDFLEWESNYIVDKKGIDDLDYWKNKFKEKIVKQPLPYDAVSKKLINPQQNKSLQRIFFQGEELKVLREKAKSLKVNLSMLMLSVFKILLYRLSDMEDIIVTMPTAGRFHQKYENGIGYYVNLLISKATVSGTLPFSMFLKILKSDFLSDIDHLQYPYPSLVRELNIEKGNVDEVFPVSFIYQNMFEKIYEVTSDERIQNLDILHQAVTNEYTMEIIDIRGQVTIDLKYRKDLFLDESIVNHLVFFKNILNAVIANPDVRIDDIEIISKEEKEKLLIDTLIHNEILPEIEVYDNDVQLLPLSISQERLWFLDKLKGSVEFHIPIILKLDGVLDQDILEATLRYTVARHKALRSVFKSKSGITHQEALPSDPWSLSISSVEDPSQLNTVLKNFINTPFDLSNDYMLRSHLYNTGGDSFILANIFHHIAIDGWSISIWLKEFTSIYTSLKNNRSPVLPELSIQYSDYVIWQHKYLNDTFLEKQLSYWKTQLADVSPLLLPTDNIRPAIQNTSGDRLFFHFDNEFKQSLEALCHKENITLFMLLLSAFKILLSRYTGQQDIAVGSPVANRTHEQVNDLVGLFINNLTLRSNLKESLSFKEFIQEIKKTTLDAYDNQLIPFEKVVDHLVVDRDMSITPLFQVMFVLQNTPDISTDIDLEGLTISSLPHLEGGESKYDITFRVTETVSGLSLEIEYRTALFKTERINKMKMHYEELLKSILNNPKECIGDLNMLSKAETDQVLVGFNTTEVSYPKEKTLVDLISDQVKRSKNAIALVFEGKEMTYQELDKRSNQLARFLRKKEAKAETLVGICIDRSFEMMVGILGILKSGAAYVPIDPEYPNERITYIVKDANLDIVISKENNAEVFREHEKLNVILLDVHWSDIAKESAVKLKRYHKPRNLAYVIYTSGSTGKPKGVMNEHAGIVNRLLWAQDHYKLDPNQDVILQKTTFCFDVSVWELFWPLISGVKLVFAKPNGHKDPVYLKNLIEEKQITTMHFIPSMLGVFLSTIKASDCASLKKVLCSGEALKLDQVSLFKKKFPNVRLDNLYGPTEAAIEVSSWEVPSNIEDLKTVLIGKPVANTKLYVLSPHQKVLPVGAVGELYIGGDQVARGYLNREELTKEKFLSDPFSLKKEARLYRTGDFVQWEPDGNINFLGRIDNQVKIRGYRIELGEIENALSGFDKINDAAVVVNKKGKEPQLIAYYQSSYEESLIDEMRRFLEQLLPSYMVPSRFIKLDTFPLTTSGKINTKKLSEIDIKSIDKGSFKKPRTETEKKVTEIWEEVLEIKNIGVNDRFFELGGSSLSLVGVKKQIEAHYGISLEFVELIKHSKISTLAFFIDQTKNEKLSNNEIKNNTQKKDKLKERRKKRK